MYVLYDLNSDCEKKLSLLLLYFPKCLQQPNLSHTKIRSQELHEGRLMRMTGTQVLGHHLHYQEAESEAELTLSMGIPTGRLTCCAPAPVTGLHRANDLHGLP